MYSAITNITNRRYKYYQKQCEILRVVKNHQIVIYLKSFNLKNRRRFLTNKDSKVVNKPFIFRIHSQKYKNTRFSLIGILSAIIKILTIASMSIKN